MHDEYLLSPTTKTGDFEFVENFDDFKIVFTNFFLNVFKRPRTLSKILVDVMITISTSPSLKSLAISTSPFLRSLDFNETSEDVWYAHVQ